MSDINPTTPTSSPLDTLKALVLRNISALEYATDRLSGDFGNNVSEDLLEFLDAVTKSQYDAIGEHLTVKTETIGLMTIQRISDKGYSYDDGSPVVEHFEGHGLTSSYYPRYDGNRDLALASHYESVAVMNRRFAEECAERAEHHDDPAADN